MERGLKEKKHPTDKGTWILHDTHTNEPVMNITPARWGREVHLNWHPDFLEKHPKLSSSYEHGNPLGRSRRGATSKNRSEAIGAAHSAYMSAGRAGFKDSIDMHHDQLSDKEFEHAKNVYSTHHANDPWSHGDLHRAEDESKVRKITHYSDPETGEKIITHKYNPELGKYQYSVSRGYISKHNIDPEVAGALTAKHPDVYDKAAALYKNKGKQAKLVGKNQSTGAYTTYKVNTTPEEASTAHEEHVTDKYPGVKINRHSPTSFTGHIEPSSTYSSGKFVTSHVIGDTLHATTQEVHHPESYSYKKYTHMIEQFASDPMGVINQIIDTINEDTPANAMSGGNIAAGGIQKAGAASNWAEPGVFRTKYSKNNEREEKKITQSNPVMGTFTRLGMPSFKGFLEK